MRKQTTGRGTFSTPFREVLLTFRNVRKRPWDTAFGPTRTDFRHWTVNHLELRTRTIVFICLAASLVLVPLMAYGGIVTYVILTSPSLAPAVAGCPSRAFPIHPGSTLRNYSEITVESDQGITTGCWAEYDQPSASTEQNVFSFYTDGSNTAGWKLDEAHAHSGFAAFSNTSVPGLRAQVDITTVRAFLIAGPSTVRLAISVCLCDPRSMAG